MSSQDQSRKIVLKRGLGQAPEDPVCDSGIFCYGPLLEAIQMARIYPDSKTFVDKKLKFPPGKIIKNFETLLNQQNGALLSVDQIKQFVEDNFDEEGHELEPWLPEDWTPEPEFIGRLRKPALRGLTKRIAKLWRDLSRRIKQDVKDNPSLYSIIYVPNGFVVPGGRFREFYYWDTYWIVKALLHYDMANTVKGIIENFLLMVSTYGLVPNGGRIYYTKRSQPPFLTLMMKEYVDKTADVHFLRTQLSTLQKELEFWETNRSVVVEKEGESHQLFMFGTGGTGPRPESYREDVELAEEFENEADREEFYFHMKAGAESGWDYSTRWMINKKGGNQGSLKDVKTNSILPVDLNALMYMNYVAVSDFHSLLGDSSKSEVYLRRAETLKRAIDSILWNESDQIWYDYDLVNDKQRKYFYPSNLFPLWAECYNPKDKDKVARSAIGYLRKTGAIRCKGGVPTSMDESGQQWDFPNAWPPLQHILVAGLLKTENAEARKIALTIARRYTVGTMFSCPDGAEVCNMFEKYNVNATGSAGGGGEYDVQTGFGWTNGVVIDFIVTFGDELLSDEVDEELEETHKMIEIELNTHFDVSRGKSKLLRKDSNITVHELEKHEFEKSEKVAALKGLVHPALAIEEDDEPVVDISQSTTATTRKKVSGLLGDVLTNPKVVATTSPRSSLASDIIEELIEEDEEEVIEGEEVKTIAGKSFDAKHESDELILHLVSTSMQNLHKMDQSTSKEHNEEEDTINIRLKNENVQVTLTDSEGQELQVSDVDLELKLPSKFQIPPNNLKGKVKRLVNRMRSKEDTGDNIMYIKEKVKVTDSSSGQSFDVEMNLKVQVPAQAPKTAQKSGSNSSFVRSILCPINMPWKCRRGGDPSQDDLEGDHDEVNDRKPSEIGRKIFVAANKAQEAGLTLDQSSFDSIEEIAYIEETIDNNNVVTKEPGETSSTKSPTDLFRFTTV